MSNRLKCKSIFIYTLIDKIYQYLLLISNIYDTLYIAILKQTTNNDKAPTEQANHKPQPEERTPTSKRDPNQSNITDRQNL